MKHDQCGKFLMDIFNILEFVDAWRHAPDGGLSAAGVWCTNTTPNIQDVQKQTLQCFKVSLYSFALMASLAIFNAAFISFASIVIIT